MGQRVGKRGSCAHGDGVRTAGGRYLFPPDIEDRLDDRERRILARIERLRALAAEDDGTGASRA